MRVPGYATSKTRRLEPAQALLNRIREIKPAGCSVPGTDDLHTDRHARGRLTGLHCKRGRMQHRGDRDPVQDAAVRHRLAVDVEDALVEPGLLLVREGRYHRDRHDDRVVAGEEVRKLRLRGLLPDVRGID